jgi:hypothetical protein
LPRDTARLVPAGGLGNGLVFRGLLQLIFLVDSQT